MRRGDFFASVPSCGDTYALTDIIHDWDDDRAVAIRRNCRLAIGGGAKLLLIERLVPPGDAPFAGAFVDITMLVLTR